MRLPQLLTTAMAAGALAACGGTGTPSSPGAGSSGSATVSTRSTSLGTVLTDSSGLTLYYLTTEKGGHDACLSNAQCAMNWPAVAPPASGSPNAGSGVSGQLAVITATNGSMEVTYNGWPLHTFSGDGGVPGKTSGNGIVSFGGTWYVVTPSLTSSGAGGASPSGSAVPYGY
jgi:predicted lipoprotein with Yx(FWY)xxD motif